MAEGSKPKILCVDDEANVLSALKRQLRHDFDVSVAEDARKGMAILLRDGPFPIVMSDMRMPVIDGVSFLSKVREKSPDSVRVLLTGYADLDSAVGAVNRGQIFRFLTKPCQREDLLSALSEAVEQYRLKMAERELLAKTLRGSIRALVEILGLASPMAFGRAQRAQQTVLELCGQMEIQPCWHIEVAALLSQIGSITLMEETLEKIHHGVDLNEEEQASVRELPDIALSLLQNIPRLDPVLEVIEYSATNYEPRRRDSDEVCRDQIPIGARVLRVALDYDSLEVQGKQGRKAIEILRGREGHYDEKVIEALTAVKALDDHGREVRELHLKDLRIGMILAEDCLSRSGALLVARGQMISEGLKIRLRAFSENVGLREPILVTIPAGLDWDGREGGETAEDEAAEPVEA
jgi:response regulator RpfG family c-di-GMP phosphodiesterase